MFTAPEAPVNLQVTEQTAHAIHLLWQHPSITNGKVRQFDVHIKLISSHLRRLEQEVNRPESVLEVQQPSRYYSYEVSEFWNLHFLYWGFNMLCGLECLLLCTRIYTGNVTLPHDVIFLQIPVFGKKLAMTTPSVTITLLEDPFNVAITYR